VRSSSRAPGPSAARLSPSPAISTPYPLEADHDQARRIRRRRRWRRAFGSHRGARPGGGWAVGPAAGPAGAHQALRRRHPASADPGFRDPRPADLRQGAGRAHDRAVRPPR
jgi:hypothetical protein